ncbi:MAG: NAD(P)/FAD-dependent oxidoreductase [SAR86 cluster bacterium]|jgi:monooxygenase|uniref:NAD(P)/FAD-dependent oxidoreductase n=1 Tax=SAR86 cluster bacterium TaxID=2030880 RepID=A0A520N1U1_9GAMM|nr:MAG: NAD(P)/FAD-dependent oxidoreductase [SAR86 cluster bacterium]
MHKDVIVVGAGISGIAAGYNLKKSCPNKSFSILEGRNDIGGTWDLFRYPGIRSDSDMHTLGYRFKPWIHDKSIADGPSILEYLNETIDENDLRNNILLNHNVNSANWNSDKSIWELEIIEKDLPKNMTCNFLFLCGGYFSYSKPHMPSFKNQEKFEGQLIHPQFWNNKIDYSNKKIIVIGSGATAITLVPAIAEKAKHVVMLQRSPSYVVSRPSEDSINKFLRKFLPIKVTYFLIRWKNILWQSYTFFLAKKFPKKIKEGILELLKDELGPEYNIQKHFTPSYKPWDQRMCLVPDSDLFKAINTNKASVVTDKVKQFESDGILLKSGEKITADIIITATGIELNSLNDIDVTLDNIKINAHERLTYKGMMLSGVPNFALSFGYVNASWTLRADLTCEYVCRLINLMDKKGVNCCAPIDDESAYGDDDLIDFTSGYVQRGLRLMPKQGNKAPWKNYQNYLKDIFAVRLFSIKDSNLNFYSHKK